MIRRIVTITDCNDIASNELRGTLVRCIDNIDRNVEILVEPFVFCKEFSILNCAFCIRLLAESYDPKNTIFLVIANALPTNRKTRARLVGETKNGFRFVSENIGAISWLLEDFGIKEVYEYCPNHLDGSSFISFGGKYFHAPEAVKVANMMNLSGYECSYDPRKLNRIDIADGCILHVDNFGVIKIKTILPDDLKEGDSLRLYLNREYWRDVVFSHSMKNLPDGTWTIYKGSSLGLAEIGCVRKLVSQEVDFRIGDIISLESDKHD